MPTSKNRNYIQVLLIVIVFFTVKILAEHLYAQIRYFSPSYWGERVNLLLPSEGPFDSLSPVLKIVLRIDEVLSGTGALAVALSYVIIVGFLYVILKMLFKHSLLSKLEAIICALIVVMITINSNLLASVGQDIQIKSTIIIFFTSMFMIIFFKSGSFSTKRWFSLVLLSFLAGIISIEAGVILVILCFCTAFGNLIKENRRFGIFLMAAAILATGILLYLAQQRVFLFLEYMGSAFHNPATGSYPPQLGRNRHFFPLLGGGIFISAAIFLVVRWRKNSSQFPPLLKIALILYATAIIYGIFLVSTGIKGDIFYGQSLFQITVLPWVATIILIGESMQKAQPLLRLIVLFLLSFVIIFIVGQSQGREQKIMAQFYVTNWQNQLSMAIGVLDPETRQLLPAEIPLNFPSIIKDKRLGFLAGLDPDKSLGNRITGLVTHELPTCIGWPTDLKFILSDPVSETFRAQGFGWAPDSYTAPANLLFTDENDVIKGYAKTLFSSFDAREMLAQYVTSHTGWIGYGAVDRERPHPIPIKIYGFSKDWSLLCKFDATLNLP